jgi:hypothetical protein
MRTGEILFVPKTYLSALFIANCDKSSHTSLHFVKLSIMASISNIYINPRATQVTAVVPRGYRWAALNCSQALLSSEKEARA